MKKLLLFSLTIALCFTANAQQDSAQFAQNILNAIKSGEIENIKKMVAPPAVYRSMFKELTDSDEEIIAHTREGEKLKNDFEKLQAAAKAKNVDLKKIQMDSITSDNLWKHDGMPWAFTIHFSVNGKKGQLPVSALRTIESKQWYFMEFLMTTTVFKEF